jgi:hypothetical protein
VLRAALRPYEENADPSPLKRFGMTTVALMLSKNNETDKAG